MSFRRSIPTTSSTPESSSLDSFRYHSSTVVVTPKPQRFKRLAKPILHPPRTKPPHKTRRSKSSNLTAAEPNPSSSSSEPHISFENTKPLSREFFQIDALDLAPRLLGKFLRRDHVVLQITEVTFFHNTQKSI